MNIEYYQLSNLLIILSIAITLISQIIITATYNKYKKVANNNKYTGYDVARKILDKNSLSNILVVETEGNLTDHYDPSRKTIKLSKDIYHGMTISSTAVAAHECGHAIQDKKKYKPMIIRSKIVPTVNLCTKIGYLSIILGFIFSYQLVEIGIILLVSTSVFQLITLPVEFNASKRALLELENLNIIEKKEKTEVKKMLIAAAFTYVASLLTSLLQILRLVVIANNRRRH